MHRENGRVNEATNSKLAEATQRPYRAFAIQEQYMRLGLTWLHATAGMFGNPVEAQRRVAEQSRRQLETWQALAEGSFRAYASLFYAPGSRDVPGGKKPEPPIKDYDRLSVEEIDRELKNLDAEGVEELKTYEKNNENRFILMERFDRSLV